MNQLEYDSITVVKQRPTSIVLCFMRPIVTFLSLIHGLILCFLRLLFLRSLRKKKRA